MNVEASLAVYEHDPAPEWGFSAVTQELIDFEGKCLLHGANWRRDGHEDLVNAVSFNIIGLPSVSKLLRQLPTPIRRKVTKIVITP